MGERRPRPRLWIMLPALVLAACGSEAQDDQPGSEEMAVPTNGELANSSFAAWDQDADQHLDPQEFTMWAQDENVFADWLEGQGVAMEVFRSNLQAALDADGDGEIDESEWSNRVQELFGDASPGTWSDWDQDGDGVLDAAEFMQVTEDRGLHARIDRNDDSVITEQEMRDFYFGVFDRNRDGLVDSNEWNQARATWLSSDGA